MLLAFEHTTNVDANLTIHFDQVGAIADQTTTFRELAKCIDRRNRMARRKRYNLFTQISEEYIVPNEKGVGPRR